MIDLHLHSTFSPQDGFGYTNEVLERAQKLGRKAAAITDHDTVIGHTYFEMDAADYNVKPIFGAEMRMVNSIEVMREEADRAKFHITLLAKDLKGYKNLMRIVSDAYNIGSYYLPTIDLGMLKRYSKGIIVLSGCMSGMIAQHLINGKYRAAKKVASWFKGQFGNRFYLEVTPIGGELKRFTTAIAEGNARLSKELGIPMVLTNDVHFIKKGQEDIWRILSSMKRHSTWNDSSEMARSCYQMPDDGAVEWATKILPFNKKQIASLFDNQERIASDCNVVIPRFSVPIFSENSHEIIVAKVNKEMKKRGFHRKKIYRDRVEMELNRIRSKGYSDYFLIVNDMIENARSRDFMVGPGRGCFLPTSNKVYTKNKMWIPIEKVKIGSKIITNDRVFRKVLDKFEYDINEECVELNLCDEFGKKKKIKCTKDHLLLTSDGWKEAMKIGRDDIIVGARESTIEEINVRCSDCGKKHSLPARKYFGSSNYQKTGEYVCFQCAMDRHAGSKLAHDNAVKGGAYWSTDVGKKRMSGIISELMDNGLRESIINGSKKYFKRWRKENPGKNCPNIVGLWNYIEEHPECLDKYIWSSSCGYYKSKKNKVSIFYQSDLEKKACMILETDPDVISYSRPKKMIPYYIDGVRHMYFPDYVFTTADGKTTLLEVKAKWAMKAFGYDKWKFKVKAAKKVVKNGEYDDFVVWTDEMLFSMNDLNHREFTLVSKKFFNYKGKVYDLKIEKVRNYSVNGITVHNSSMNSLVCYLFGITAADPIYRDLTFDRFISEDRMDLPDIDVDFEDRHRQEVIEYITERYGDDNVAQLSTFAHYASKNTLSEVGKVFGVPASDIELLKKGVIYRGTADARASLELADVFAEHPHLKKILDQYPEILNASLIEGQVRHFSSHAAGIVMSKEPLYQSAAITWIKGRKTVSFDGYGAEHLDLLKMDVLGIKTLSVIKDTLDDSKLPQDFFAGNTLDEDKTFKIFNDDRLSGIFQFSGDAARSLLKQVTIEQFADLVIMNALPRPGPFRCMSYDTLLYNPDGDEYITIEEAYNKKIKRTLSLFPDGTIKPQKINRIEYTGKKDIYEVSLYMGGKKNKKGAHKTLIMKKFYCTKAHKVLTERGYVKVLDLKQSDRVLTSSGASPLQKRENLIEGGKSTRFKRGAVPWNQGKECPQISVAIKKLRDEGFYDNVDTGGLRKFKKKHPRLFKKIQRNATDAATDRYNLLSEKEKRKFLKPFISAGSEFGYGWQGKSSDGHHCQSSFELGLEEWLIEHNIKHIPHPIIPGTVARRADQKIKGIYIELDGMCREPEYWDEKYKNCSSPYYVIDVRKQKSEGFQEFISREMDFALAVPTNWGFKSIVKVGFNSIKYIGRVKTYDLEMEGEPNYIADGVVVHNSGQAQTYCDYKKKGIRHDWGDELLNEITSDTLGLFIFQEQILRVCREIGKMDWKDVTSIRSAMSKSLGEDYFNEYREHFRPGAKEYGFDDGFIDELWDAFCFPAGTPVLVKTPYGAKNRKIEDVKKGDLVLSYNIKTGEKEWDKVIKNGKRKTGKLLYIQFDNNNELECTPEHPFAIVRKGKICWVKACDIKVGDRCMQYNYSGLASRLYRIGQRGISNEKRLGKEVEKKRIRKFTKTLRSSDSGVKTNSYIVKVTNIELCEDDIQTVYNIETEKNHNYFAQGILVHNCHYGCLTGDSKIKTEIGNITIEELYEKYMDGTLDFKIYSLDESGDRILLNDVHKVIYSGRKSVYQITLSNGWKIKATENHKFYTPDGWVRLGKLIKGNVICTEYLGQMARVGRDPEEFSEMAKSKNSSKNAKLLKMRNRVDRSVSSIEKQQVSMKAWWDSHPEEKESMYLNFLDSNLKPWNYGKNKSNSSKIKKMAKKQSITRKKGIANGTINVIRDHENFGYGNKYVSTDGHYCYSSHELKLDEWLIENELQHVPQPIITGTSRFADHLVKGIYIEMDGMNRDEQYWDDKYQGKKYIVVSPNSDLDTELAFLLDDQFSVLGSKKVKGNHTDVKWRQIISIRKIGVRRTYDISMASPYNSFIANHLVVHNSWAFVKGHATAYSTLAYWTAYLKAHYPKAFYKNALNHGSDDAFNELLRDFNSECGDILAPKINKSAIGFKREGKNLRAGLSHVPGIGANAAQAIIDEYPIKDIDELQEKIPRRVCNIRVINAINDWELFDEESNPDVFDLYSFTRRLEHIEERTDSIGNLRYVNKNRQVTLFGIISIPKGTSKTPINLKSVKEYEETYKFKKGWKKRFQGSGRLDKWCLFNLQDDTGQLQVQVMPREYERFSELLWTNDHGVGLIKVTGTIPRNKLYIKAKYIESHYDYKAAGAECWSCPLSENEFVPSTNNGKKEIMIIGKAPSHEEVDAYLSKVEDGKDASKGSPFAGDAGKVLKELLHKSGLKRKDVYISNVVSCHPSNEQGSNREPTEEEAGCCYMRLMEEIAEVEPSIIVALGKTAFITLTDKDEPLGIVDGKVINMKDFKVIPTYHPAFTFRDRSKRKNIRKALTLAAELCE